ncbi:MAG: hypothetical protein V3V96_02490 [Acidiferrobacterales bacterium]
MLLPAWQTLQEAEATEKELSFYVIAWCVETLAWQRSFKSKTLTEIRDRMEANKRSRQGLDAYQRLYNEFEEVYDDLVTDALREFGEDDLARLYRKRLGKLSLSIAAGAKAMRWQETVYWLTPFGFLNTLGGVMLKLCCGLMLVR